jgi:hypothetical protein
MLWCAPGLAGPGDETAQVLRMSALNEEGVMAVRSAACDRLLASRVDLKLKVGVTHPADCLVTTSSATCCATSCACAHAACGAGPWLLTRICASLDSLSTVPAYCRASAWRM